MTTTDPILSKLWGKTPAQATDPPAHFHPVLSHMLDVACVAEVLLSDQAVPRLRQVLRYTWHGCDLDALVAWLPFLIATHDLGKISAAFQGQVPPQRERLEQQHGLIFPPPYTNAPFHAEISAVWLATHLPRREPGTPHRLVAAVRDAMGGHHGRFPQEAIRTIRARLQRSERDAPEWERWRDTAYTRLRHMLAPAGQLAALGVPQRLRPATAALTGFIILSDWIGSNSVYFPAAPDVPLETYLRLARARAVQAVSLAGLMAHYPAPTYDTFSELFPGMQAPRALQLAIDDVPDAACAGPLLGIIEAPPGEGKTEAGLALAQRLAARMGYCELFFALPTMATSNQMFGRLSSFYDAQYGAAVRLTHSQAAVVEAELRRAALAGDQDAAEPVAASALAAIEWFTGPKKALIAPFGVGTVDQVELAGLNVRHYMLRLFALAGKVVIIDEVHAYDTYMSVILEHTVAWLASLGTSVLLLSATLPANRHRALVASYLRGLDPHLPAPEVPPDLPYPAISLYAAGKQHRATPTVFRPDQRLTVRMSPKLAPNRDACHLINLVHDGGAVARICNRVDDAQAIYQALQARLPADQRILLHARFPLNQRQDLEARMDMLVGKTTQRTPDQPLIIVGTPVLEQSLDYDVDVMVSDFAPIDLLLQRAGRLHRHHWERTGQRPPRHVHPVLEIVFPQDQDALPVWQRWEKMYQAYILWRTWEVLCAECHAETSELVLPGDYRRLIEAVYQDEPQIPVAAPHRVAMLKAWATLQHHQGEMRSHARTQLTPPSERTDALTDVADRQFAEDNAEALAGWQVAQTRWGDRIMVVPLYRLGDTWSLEPTPDSGLTLSPDRPPDQDEQKALLARTIPISAPRIMAEFRAEERRDLRRPWPPPQVPRLLRALFPLLLEPTTRTARFQAGMVRLDQELGLLIEQEDA